MEFIPFAPPYIGEEEIDSVAKVMRSGWLTMGPLTMEFEEKFRKYIGAKHAIAVNSCTSALFLSLYTNGITKGDEVITSPTTFAATANTVHHVGARPVFADVDRETINLDPDAVRKKITERTKAIVPVHYGGQPCEMKEIRNIAAEHDLLVIEDAAHASGAEYDGKKIGSDNTACFSFYVTKPMTMGEGGMITTNDDKLAERMKILRLHGISKDAWKRYSAVGSWYYEVIEAGFKFNTTDVNSAIGVVQLSKLDNFNSIRKNIFEHYNEGLSNVNGVITPTVRSNVKSTYHLYPLLLEKKDRGAFIEKMKKKNIGTSVHFIPLHLMPFYQKEYGYKRGDFPNAEWVYDREVSLPIYPQLTEATLEYITKTVEELVA